MNAKVAPVIGSSLIELQQDLALFRFSQQRQLRDAPLRIGRDFFQQLAVSLHHPTDGCRLEKIGVVAERALEAVTPLQQIGRQIKFLVSVLRLEVRDR